MNQTHADLPTMLFYGNCQAHVIAQSLAKDPVAAGLFRYAYLPSYANAESGALAFDGDLSRCTILCEQIGWNEFPERDRLPANGTTVRFPSLDSTLLWPFHCMNPYNVPDPPEFPIGRFQYGDRIVLREIERDRSADDVLSYYLNGWDDYKLDMTRVRELERFRLEKRDLGCDVPARDLVLDRIRTERLFWSINHPRKELLFALAGRVIEACAAREPALRAVDVDALAWQYPAEGSVLDEIVVPIHPEVAREVGLEWYDPNAVYRECGGASVTYPEYFGDMIRYCIANREHHLGGGALVAETGAEWRLPLRGPAVQSESGLGYFPDGFIGGRLSCRITPHAPVTTVTIRGYCPRQHDGPVVLTCSIDGRAPRSEAVSPGSAFAIELAAAAATGRTMRLDIGSSRVMNPLERGESEDSRDLSVLILAVEVS